MSTDKDRRIDAEEDLNDLLEQHGFCAMIQAFGALLKDREHYALVENNRDAAKAWHLRKVRMNNADWCLERED